MRLINIRPKIYQICLLMLNISVIISIIHLLFLKCFNIQNLSFYHHAVNFPRKYGSIFLFGQPDSHFLRIIYIIYQIIQDHLAQATITLYQRFHVCIPRLFLENTMKINTKFKRKLNLKFNDSLHELPMTANYIWSATC